MCHKIRCDGESCKVLVFWAAESKHCSTGVKKKISQSRACMQNMQADRTACCRSTTSAKETRRHDHARYILPPSMVACTVVFPGEACRSDLTARRTRPDGRAIDSCPRALGSALHQTSHLIGHTYVPTH